MTGWPMVNSKGGMGEKIAAKDRGFVRDMRHA